MAQPSLPPFSETVKLAWRLAAEEAVHAGSPQIEPPHLLLGIFGVDRVIREESWERYAVSTERLEIVRQEWNDVCSAGAMAGLDAIHLRREVRARLPKISLALPANHVAKRSDATRSVFDHAGQRAGMAGRGLTTLFDLLGALLPAMVDKDPLIPEHFSGALRKLQTLMAPPPVSGVTLRLDATRTSINEPLEHLKTSPREALFYDLPLQMASQANYQAMLDCAVGSLLNFFPAASHAVMLLRDRGSNCLLLQAHLPAGEPSASMELAEHVLQQNSAVVWNHAAAASSDISTRSLIGMQNT